jgi:hypothetical protein
MNKRALGRRRFLAERKRQGPAVEPNFANTWEAYRQESSTISSAVSVSSEMQIGASKSHSIVHLSSPA